MQDLPPIQGYEPVQWKRNLPARGFRPAIYFWIIVGTMGFGFYRHYKGIDEQRELLRERQWARFYLQPLLLAEDDRNTARRYFSEMKRQDMVRESMSEETKQRYDQELYHDKSKLRLPRYTAGVHPNEKFP